MVCIRQDESLTRFANNHIHQNVTETNYEITIRCVVGTRVGTAVSNDTRIESLRTLVRRACELATLQPENPEFKGLPGPVPMESTTHAFDPKTASCSPAHRAAGVGVACRKAAALGYTAAGSMTTGAMTISVANSKRCVRGVRVHDCGCFHSHHEWKRFRMVSCFRLEARCGQLGAACNRGFGKSPYWSKNGRCRACGNAGHPGSLCHVGSAGHAGIRRNERIWLIRKNGPG